MTKSDIEAQCRAVFGEYGWKIALAEACGASYSNTKRWFADPDALVPWYAAMIVELAAQVPPERWPRNMRKALSLPRQRAPEFDALERWAGGAPPHMVTILMLLESIPAARRPWDNSLAVGGAVNASADGARPSAFLSGAAGR